ncbi:MAG: MarR family transcriptional regulator [Isosphaeraceae bacterium]
MKQSPSELEDHLGYWLRCLSNFVHQGFATRLDRHGVSVPQWVVLRCLFDREDSSLGDLAASVGVDHGALSRMVERLVQKGLLRRETDPSNRRAVRLGLTEAGKELVPKLAKEADENDAAFFGVLDDRERTRLLLAVRTVLAANGWRSETHGKAVD